MKPSKGFTLLELLVVISILATLAAVTVVVLNPAELLKRSRDSQRLNDMAAVTSAISFYMVEATTPDLDGTSGPACAGATANKTDASVSLTANADTTLTAGATSTTPGAIDGSGWIPVNLSSLTGIGSPLPAFPVDPTNTYNGAGATLTGLYYSYACRASPLGFQLVANFESANNDSKEQNDGGNRTTLYETGTIASYLTTTALDALYDGIIN